MNRALAGALVRDMGRVPEYVPGRSVEEVCESYGFTPREVSKNASNENALGPSPLAMEAVRAAAAGVHVYPEPVSRALSEKVAALRGVAPGQLVFGNGSDEVLDFVMKLFVAPGDAVVMPSCTFQMYGLMADIYGARAVKVPLKGFRLDLEAMLSAVCPETKVVFVCNPNNPTGDFYPHDEIVRFVSRLPEGVVAVIDEAYAEFAPGYPGDAAAEVIAAHPLSVVVRTFSKIYGLAGLRVGYGMMDAETAGCMMRIKPPFNNGTVAQSAALAALGDSAYIKNSLALVAEGRDYLYAEFGRLGCRYVPTGANFICLSPGVGAGQAIDAFIRGGIIVRGLEAFAMPEFIRYTIGTAATNRRFVSVLEGLLGGASAGGK